MQWHELGFETNSLGDVSLGKEKSSIATMILLAQKVWSNDFFKIFYHAGSTKHLPRPEVKRRHEDSSPSFASTPKKRKTGFAGKIGTYPLAYPLTPPSNFIFPSPAFVK